MSDDLHCASCGTEIDEGWHLCEDCEDAEENDFSDSDGDICYARLLSREGIRKNCVHCEASFLGLSDHGVCPTCADSIEMGMEV